MTAGPAGTAPVGDGLAELRARLHAERPVLGAMVAEMRFKRALVERLGVQAAFSIVAREPGLRGDPALRRRRIRALGDVARSEGMAYRELWPGGTLHHLPLPPVVGVGDHGPIAVTDRRAYLACLGDVLLHGRSDVLLRGDEALIDFEGDEYVRTADHPEYDPVVLHATATEAWTLEPAAGVPVIDEALTLCGTHARGFGHWVAEFLPKLATARLAGWNGGMPVLVDRAMPATLHAALQRLLPADAPLITLPDRAPRRVQRLWCAPNVAYPGFYPSGTTHAATGELLAAPPRLATLLRALGAMADDATARPTGVPCLYLARRPGQRKQLVDATGIATLLERHGFACVYPEELDFVEQLRLARHARFIVAAAGSNSLLALFARPGARACLLGPPHTHRLTDVCATLAELGVDPVLFTGPSDPTSPGHSNDEFWAFWNDYCIDPVSFESFLKRWLQSA